MEKVLVCLDGSELSKAVCDYGIDIAKKLNLPLVLLNVIEHSHISKKVNLSGNIGLGSKDDLLDELANEEMNESKQLIVKGKAVLKEMEEYVKSQNLTNYTTLQKHGTLYETLDELSSDLRIAIIGLKGESSSNIGSHIEELIRTLNIPIFLVNKEFTTIKSMLMAYDGSEYANKAISIGTQSPIFPNVKRHLVNVNKDKETSNRLLNEAKQMFANANIDVETSFLSGDSIESILQYQKENNLDIIAMGAYSHNRFRSAIFGSFTTKMLLNSKVPLLLFR
ncbi:universal stress protein [Aliarcobacter cryaerophilus]|uniref:universal stress protein n=1 Tax=Aliarcobacter TaxID=2321111 RepID=UPI0021B27021|nr:MULTISPECIES: universal stress protein [Aliarcobacter]MCT7464034.1 universal stress protein [Aliarcobacter cryaerophilus]MCT7554657.1 universal stress protein [Aliarcobacter butzleri]